MKRLLLFAFICGCSTKATPVNPIKPVDPNPNHLPAEILKLHPKSYYMGSPPGVCDNRAYQCKRGVDGYMQQGSDDLCYCIPMKCTLDSTGKQICIDLKPRTP